MYHSLIHNNNNLDSSRTSFPSERHLYMQAARGPGEPGLVLSTDAKPRLKWTPELHSRFVEAVKQLGGERRIEVQGKYLQSVLEKAQEAFGKQNSGSAGLEIAKTQLSELISTVSNECFTSAFPCLEKTYGSHNQEGHMAPINDCSMYTCLTSCEESQNEREMHDTNMVLTGYYHGNLSLGTQELERIQSGRSEDLNGNKIFSQTRVKDSTQNTLPVSRHFDILSMSKSEGIRNSEVHPRQNEEHNSYLDQADYERYAIQQRSLRNPSEFELPSATTQLDLNACDEYNVSQNGNGFDLNGFSWS